MPLKVIHGSPENGVHESLQILLFLAGIDCYVVSGESRRLISITLNNLFVRFNKLSLDHLAQLAANLKNCRSNFSQHRMILLDAEKV